MQGLPQHGGVSVRPSQPQGMAFGDGAFGRWVRGCNPSSGLFLLPTLPCEDAASRWHPEAGRPATSCEKQFKQRQHRDKEASLRGHLD